MLRIRYSKGELSTKQAQAIELIVRGKTGLEVAAEIGINNNTLTEWKKQSTFSERLQQAISDYAALKTMTVEDKLAALENKAISTLEELMSSKKSDSVRLKAAQLILTHKNTRKSESEGAVLVNFNLPEPGMPGAENIEEGDTTSGEN